MIAPRE